MENYTDSFNEHSDSLRLKGEAADRDDYNFAQGNVDVGRMRKHLPAEEIDPVTGKRKKQAEIEAAIQRTLDWLLLNDAAYRQAHENLMSSIRSAQTITQSALERVLETLQAEQTIMDEILSIAAKLPDGTKVFEDEDGKVRNEDGEIIPPELAATIEWTGNEPSYEEYLALKMRIFELEEMERELLGIETEIGGIRDQATDNDNPIVPNDLEPKTNTINGLRDRVFEIEESVLDHSPDIETNSVAANEFENRASVSELSAKPSISIVIATKP